MSKVRLLESHFRQGASSDAYVQLQVPRRCISIQQNVSKFPYTAFQRWAKPLMCLLCLPVQCSQSTCGGEVVQQWGLLFETVFPATHHLKGSRTYKHRERYEERLCLLQQQGLSPGMMGNKPFVKDTVSDCSLIALYLCR